MSRPRSRLRLAGEAAICVALLPIMLPALWIGLIWGFIAIGFRRGVSVAGQFFESLRP